MSASKYKLLLDFKCDPLICNAYIREQTQPLAPVHPDPRKNEHTCTLHYMYVCVLRIFQTTNSITLLLQLTVQHAMDIWSIA